MAVFLVNNKRMKTIVTLDCLVYVQISKIVFCLVVPIVKLLI